MSQPFDSFAERIVRNVEFSDLVTALDNQGPRAIQNLKGAIAIHEDKEDRRQWERANNFPRIGTQRSRERGHGLQRSRLFAKGYDVPYGQES